MLAGGTHIYITVFTESIFVFTLLYINVIHRSFSALITLQGAQVGRLMQKGN